VQPSLSLYKIDAACCGTTPKSHIIDRMNSIILPAACSHKFRLSGRDCYCRL
jgi:hypothetical protein